MAQPNDIFLIFVFLDEGWPFYVGTTSSPTLSDEQINDILDKFTHKEEEQEEEEEEEYWEDQKKRMLVKVINIYDEINELSPISFKQLLKQPPPPPLERCNYSYTKDGEEKRCNNKVFKEEKTCYHHMPINIEKRKKMEDAKNRR